MYALLHWLKYFVWPKLLFNAKLFELGEFVEFGNEWFFTVASSLSTLWLLHHIYFYLLHCIPIWIQLKCLNHQNKNEWIVGCLKWFGLAAGNHRNMDFPEWVMYLKHHHKRSRSHSWKNRLFVVFIWQLHWGLKRLGGVIFG